MSKKKIKQITSMNAQNDRKFLLEQIDFLNQLHVLIDSSQNTQGMFNHHLSNYILNSFEDLNSHLEQTCSKDELKELSTLIHLLGKFSEQYFG